jgi:hypothetical protein
MERRFVINADDYGISNATNRGIQDAAAFGILTSTSVLANMPGFNHAVNHKDELENIGFGAHLSLNMGKPVLPVHKVKSLINEDGSFLSSYMKHVMLKKDSTLLKEAKNELIAQISKLLDNGFVLDHVNSQSHIHMIPAYFQIFKDIADKFKIKHIRTTIEPILSDFSYFGINRIKVGLINTVTNNHFNNSSLHSIKFKGLLRSNGVVKKQLNTYIKNLKGTYEICTHPGYLIDQDAELYEPWVYDFLMDDKRELELQALLDEDLKDLIHRENIILAKFSDLY